MGLPSVNIPRQNGQLPLTIPTEDAVVGLIVGNSGANMDPYTCHQLFSYQTALERFSTDEDWQILDEIRAFYEVMGNGAELNVMTVPNYESLAMICDMYPESGGVKTLLDFMNGRCALLGIQPTFIDNPSAARLGGLHASIRQGVDKLNDVAKAYDAAGMPFVAVVPGYGFSANNAAALPTRTAIDNNDFVAISLACDAQNGVVSIGKLLGNIAKNQVHQNIARVANGKVSDTAFFPDGTPIKALQDSLGAIHDKGYILYRQFVGKSGFFYNDDPCSTPPTSDYSSISWNRVINKAKRLAYSVLIEKLVDDVELDANSGKIESTVAADWESDVEAAIKQVMLVASGTKVREISGVKCTVSADSDIVNGLIDASLQIVRNGQAKTITLKIGYTASI